MTNPHKSLSPHYKNNARNKLGIIAVTSAFLFAISAVGPANAAQMEDQVPPTTTATIPIQEKLQTLTVQANAIPVAVTRDSYTATSEAELAQIVLAAQIKQQAETAAAQKATLAASGPTKSLVSTALVAPNQVVPANNIISAAQQWVGVVPYGNGNNPSDSFSCDGYVQYVYAQNGISLPRGADAQAHRGTAISQADAKAGDLLWWPNQHIGIYDGNGGMYDSPDWGRMVQHRSSIWGNPVFIRI